MSDRFRLLDRPDGWRVVSWRRPRIGNAGFARAGTATRVTSIPSRSYCRDYAHVFKDLSDTHFPKAKKIVPVQDNLNTHKPASLYEAFPAPEARRKTRRLAGHG
jgi:hypothetical protein